MRTLVLMFSLFFYAPVFSQALLSGTVVDGNTNLPLEGVSVTLQPNGFTTVTDESGRFVFLAAKTSAKSVRLSSIGYISKTILPGDLKDNTPITLFPEKVQLKAITVTAGAGKEYQTISKTDIHMRIINNSQEVLRMVPGLFIGQHQGGGKAEQIFIRGFDADHGTDIAITTDGIPVNMVSHAHGQGYADMHYIIPETIDNVDFQKGPYQAAKGNFTTSGFVDLRTRNGIANNQVKLEGGMFDSYRGLGMFNLLNKKASQRQQSLYVASEFAYSNGYFDAPQHFNRYNFFSKYNGKVNNNTYLIVTASGFSSKWDASGQIPDRAVESGQIGFYGAIDDTEGGRTSRTNINTQLITTLRNGSLLKNQFYYSRYHFDLVSNFTFYLNDPVNGDQIRQRENRNLLGYNGTYQHQSKWGTMPVHTELGIGVRYDRIHNLELSNTKNKFTVLNRLAFGNVAETNASVYISETLQLSEEFTLNGGLRLDQLFNRYTDHLKNDSLFQTTAAILSPKLNLTYHKSGATQLYFNLGKGFHSNDTRVAAIAGGRKVLPAAYSADLGIITKPFKNLLLQAAAWYLWLDQEFVYSGDGAYVEPSGKTKRTGFDLSVRYEPVTSVYIDADLNYAHGRFAGSPKGADYIPLAPVWSSTGGITYKNKTGISGSFRYRWLGNRPANEDYSTTARGYMVNDLVLQYATRKYEIGISFNNIFNIKWKETQFDTESRLKNELLPVQEIHFTPGTKLAAKLSFSIFF